MYCFSLVKPGGPGDSPGCPQTAGLRGPARAAGQSAAVRARRGTGSTPRVGRGHTDGWASVTNGQSAIEVGHSGNVPQRATTPEGSTRASGFALRGACKWPAPTWLSLATPRAAVVSRACRPGTAATSDVASPAPPKLSRGMSAGLGGALNGAGGGASVWPAYTIEAAPTIASPAWAEQWQREQEGMHSLLKVTSRPCSWPDHGGCPRPIRLLPPQPAGHKLFELLSPKRLTPFPPSD